MTPNQRRHNKIIGWVLAAFVVAVFAWTVFRGASLFTGVALR